MTVLSPADEADLTAMLAWALNQPGPVAIRYPKAVLETGLTERFGNDRSPIEAGHAEPLLEGRDGLIIGCGSLIGSCLEAADQLREEGLDVGLLNARFIKPLDQQSLLHRLEAAAWVVTVEENTTQGGFGSAVLEVVNEASLRTGPILRLGIPDRFVEHGDRGELLAELGLDAAGIATACRKLAGRETTAAVSIPVHE